MGKRHEPIELSYLDLADLKTSADVPATLERLEESARLIAQLCCCAEGMIPYAIHQIARDLEDVLGATARHLRTGKPETFTPSYQDARQCVEQAGYLEAAARDVLSETVEQRLVEETAGVAGELLRAADELRARAREAA